MRLALTITVVSLSLVPGLSAADWKPDRLPREEEIRAALSAGPPHFREQAGVWVLGPKGFEQARDSKNGFHCLVERSHKGAFEPQCFDEEGARTLMQALLLRAELRMGGADDETVRREVARAWAEGRLRAPARPGINYMLSPENRVPIDEKGETIIPYRPHLMFYVPYLTNSDLGTRGPKGAPVFVINEGGPGAYAIVPVPEELSTHGGH